jgi:hypothetical protein
MIRILRFGGGSMDDRIDKALAGSKTVAVVGISDKPDRPSHVVAKYLQEKGYRIVPVNPMLVECWGEGAARSRRSRPRGHGRRVRKPEDVPPIAEEAAHQGEILLDAGRRRKPPGVRDPYRGGDSVGDGPVREEGTREAGKIDHSNRCRKARGGSEWPET